MNGVSTNAETSSESLNEQNVTSTLTIHNFHLSDVNIPYECTYGFTKYVICSMLEIVDRFICKFPLTRYVNS